MNFMHNFNFDALFQHIHIETYRRDMLVLFSMSFNLSKMELVTFFHLCKSAWYIFTIAQENIPAKLKTQYKKKSS